MDHPSELVNAATCFGEALVRTGGSPSYCGDEAVRDDARCFGNVVALFAEDVFCCRGGDWGILSLTFGGVLGAGRRWRRDLLDGGCRGAWRVVVC